MPSGPFGAITVLKREPPRRELRILWRPQPMAVFGLERLHPSSLRGAPWQLSPSQTNGTVGRNKLTRLSPVKTVALTHHLLSGNRQKKISKR